MSASTTTETQHGLAGKIRAATESETFDLAGLSASTIASTIQHAFATPFDPLGEDDNNDNDVGMIRLTLVTGAGKGGRAKYDENAAKVVGQELRTLGYELDSSASCVAECAGSYKLQHDTGKNLKTVVIFPKLLTKERGEAGTSKWDSRDGDGDNAGPVLLSGPEEMLALSSTEMFQTLVQSKCPSWSEKKGCNAALVYIQEMVAEIEQRLMQGTVLSESEQTLYDSVSADSMQKKLDMVRDLMHQQVESGNLTGREKKLLLSQVTERLETLDDDIATAQAEKKPKRVEKLTQTKTTLQARKDMLQNITPQQAHPLKHQTRILELRTELVPLLALEEGTKGRLLTVKETQQLSRKDEILEDVDRLEQSSRGWFEDDDAFTDRLERCKAVASSKTKKNNGKTAKKTGGNVATSSRGNAWVTTATTTAKPKARRPVPAEKKTKKGSGGSNGLFAAMMLDDSDSD